MSLIWRHLPEAGLVTLAVLLPWLFLWTPRLGRPWTAFRLSLAMLSNIILCCTFLLLSATVTRALPPAFSQWARALGLTWAAVIIWIAVVRKISQWLDTRAAKVSTSSGVSPATGAARRHFLRVAAAAAYATPAALACAAIIQRTDLRMREIDMRIPGLPKDLDGLRMVQLSDIHLGEFLSRKELARAVDAANETRAHITLVTGDLISYDGDPLEECLAELMRLRSDAGTFGCLGNHETYAHAENKVTQWGARLGMRFLRHESMILKFGDAKLNLAGVDYQPFRKPYLVDAQSLVDADAFNVLLSHNPDVFPVARQKGFPLTISGHTHGGQVNIEFLNSRINPARFFTRYTSGLYEEDRASLFVTRGIGTIGVPARLGAPPEVALIRLRAV